MQVKFWLDSDDAELQGPQYADAHAAGVDLRAATDLHIPANSYARVETLTGFEIPEGFYGKIEGRSGWCAKFGVFTTAGVIDSNYRGTVSVLLHTRAVPIDIKKNDRVAQMIVQPCVRCALTRIQPHERSQTLRGAGGFGSTGTA